MRKLLLGGAMFGLCASVSFGASFKNVVNGVWNTGLDNASAILTGGTVDSHFTLVPPTACVGSTALNCSEDGVSTSNPFGPATYVVLGPNGTFPLVPGAWTMQNSATNNTGNGSQWIGPRANQSSENPADALFSSTTDFYLYRLSFNLTALGLNPATAIIKLQWISDNAPNSGSAATDSHINLNGTMVLNSGNPGQSSSTMSSQITISSGFTSGVNTLDFIVFNSPVSGANPTGMRVVINEATADAASVPEPATLSFLAAGLLGMGLMARRKR